MSAPLSPLPPSTSLHPWPFIYFIFQVFEQEYIDFKDLNKTRFLHESHLIIYSRLLVQLVTEVHQRKLTQGRRGGGGGK